jgi:hypothetical protein
LANIQESPEVYLTITVGNFINKGQAMTVTTERPLETIYLTLEQAAGAAMSTRSGFATGSVLAS